jgi:hypothetical protein
MNQHRQTRKTREKKILVEFNETNAIITPTTHLNLKELIKREK